MPPLTHASLAALTGHRVAAALSGGADSVALALWLHAQAARPSPRVHLAGLIHINHHLRGAASDQDETFCRALAARLGVPIDVVDAPVTGLGRRSPESAARAARYRAFAGALGRLDATRVATAHTADDQAETVLLRLMRGTTSRGLSGIRAVRIPYVRPLLACRRRDLRSWLRAAGESWCEDASNADCSIARNRVRHELLPVVERISPGAIAALARAAQFAAEDEDVLHAQAIEMAPAIVLRHDTHDVDLDRARLQALPPAIARRLVRNVLEGVAPGSAWRAEHIEAIRRLVAREQGGGRLQLPAVTIERASDRLRIRAGGLTPVLPYSYTLPVPGAVSVPEAGLEIIAAPAASKEHDPAYSLVMPSDVALPLTVRNRRAGDRIACQGGTRKVQDLMVDAKIPRSDRDRVALIVTADGRILWAIGVSGARCGPPEFPAAGMVVLRFRKMERT